MSELFDGARKLRSQKDLEDARHRSGWATYDQKRRNEFESLTTMVAAALDDIGAAFYGRFLCFPKYSLHTVRYGQEAGDSLYLGWHLCRPHGDPAHAIISVSLDGAKFRITIQDGIRGTTYSRSRSRADLESALKGILGSLP